MMMFKAALLATFACVGLMLVAFLVNVIAGFEKIRAETAFDISGWITILAAIAGSIACITAAIALLTS
jgi:hypothetical protein